MGSAWFFGVVAIAAGGAAACSAKDLSEFNAGGAAGAGASTSSGGSSGSAGQGGTGNAGATGGSGGATGGSGGATGGSGGATGGSGGATGGSGGATGGSGGATGGSGGATGGSGGATGGSGGATGGTGGCSSQTLTTAWMSPAEAQDEGPGGAWIFESHVDKSDNQRATSTIVGSGNTSVLQALDFGFQIPNTATILGIELSIERSASVGSAMKDLGVKLGLDGSAFSVTKEESQAWPTADAYTSYGSATDTWSIPGLSPFIVNSKKFDAHLTARCYEASTCAPGVEARVDHMRMRITYKTTCN